MQLITSKSWQSVKDLKLSSLIGDLLRLANSKSKHGKETKIRKSSKKLKWSCVVYYLKSNKSFQILSESTLSQKLLLKNSLKLYPLQRKRFLSHPVFRA